MAGGVGQAVRRQAALRTENIQSMFVTLETSQFVMFPYVASAATGFAFHSDIATARALLPLPKVPGG